MKTETSYAQDLAAIRQMMDRSSRFTLLSGWAGIAAGLAALAGAAIVFFQYNFNPQAAAASSDAELAIARGPVLIVAVSVFIVSLIAAVVFISGKAKANQKQAWDATSRRLVNFLFVPFLASVVVMLLLLQQALVGWLAPFSLIFYGLALWMASRLTPVELKYLALFVLLCGLLSAWLVQWGVALWAAGFGLGHIIYGIYVQSKYSK